MSTIYIYTSTATFSLSTDGQISVVPHLHLGKTPGHRPELPTDVFFHFVLFALALPAEDRPREGDLGAQYGPGAVRSAAGLPHGPPGVPGALGLLGHGRLGLGGGFGIGGIPEGWGNVDGGFRAEFGFHKKALTAPTPLSVFRLTFREFD